MEGVVILLLCGFVIGLILATFAWRLARNHAIERWKCVEIAIDKLSKISLSKDDIDLCNQKDLISVQYKFKYDEFEWTSYVKYYKETDSDKWYIYMLNTKTARDTPKEMSLKKPTTYQFELLNL